MSKVWLRCDMCEDITGYAETPCKFYPNSNVISKYEDHERGFHIWMGEDGNFKHVCSSCDEELAKARRLIRQAEGRQ